MTQPLYPKYQVDELWNLKAYQAFLTIIYFNFLVSCEFGSGSFYLIILSIISTCVILQDSWAEKQSTIPVADMNRR